MITITINGKDIQIDKPMTVLEAAKTAGIKIPTLCHHQVLKPYGGCRLCVVEVERIPKLQNSCTLMAADGMVIRTESDAISKARRGILELLLINHPLDCPYCDKAGECELQDLVDKYGPTVGRYNEEKRKVPESHTDQILTRNMERCVVCTRCVRMCEGIQGASAIAIIGRGNRSRMEPFSSTSFNCEYCGNCLSVCPVGAILSRLYIHSYRPWQIDKEVETICPYCGVGCTLGVQIRDNSIKRVIPKFGRGLNNGLLCSRGRFGYEFTGSSERLTKPLIRIAPKDSNKLKDKNSSLVTRHSSLFREASWDEALSIVANKLSEIKNKNGGKAIAGIASARCTNEDNYIFQKFMRLACRTNNIDSISRMGFASAQRYIEDLLGQGTTSNIIKGIENSDAIFVLGGDPTTINPILGLAIRAAARDGSKVAVLGDAKGLERFKILRIISPLFKEAALLEMLLTNTAKVKGIRGEKPAVDKKIKELIEKTINVDIDTVAANKLIEILTSSKSISIICGTEIVQRTDGHRALFAIAGLTYLLEARLYILSERPNEQGVIDMGCQPDMLPGGRPLGISDFRHKFESIWKAAIPEEEGKTLMEIIEGIKNREIKALYVMGENPAFNIPDSSSVKEALRSLDFLVVQDIFFSETAMLADVVLPASGWAEKNGTFTNLERRIQLLRKAIDSSAGMEDWRIISEIANKMGYKMDYSESEGIMTEIARVSPLYRDLTYKEIAEGNCLWPYNGEPLRGEIKEVPITEGRSIEYKADSYLAVEKPLFHSGTLSTRSPALRKIYPEPTLKIGSIHAGKLGLKEGDDIRVSTDRGSIDIKVSIDETIKDSKVLISNNFEGNGVFSFLSYTIDPVTKAPGLEGCEVIIKQISEKR